MKKLITVLFLSLGFIAAHADEVVKSCHATIKMPDTEVVTANSVQIIRRADLSLYAEVKQTSGGETTMDNETASIDDYKVTHDLSKFANSMGEEELPHDLNIAELTIIVALSFERNIPAFPKTGIDLKAIRSVKFYKIAEQFKLGQLGILETYDAAGKPLGSFLNMLMIAKCE